MNHKNLRLGMRVLWTDPDPDAESKGGTGRVVKIQSGKPVPMFDDEVISLKMDDGGEVECFASELSPENIASENIISNHGKVVGRHICNDARVVATEWFCHICGKPVDEQVVVWAQEDGTLDADKGHPFCEACLPPDPDDEGWANKGWSK